jgi:hypothetical protein
MNAMFFISAYRQGNTWLFDDKQRGIVAEPFVCGASELIQKYLDKKGITATQDVPLVFSLNHFPDAEVTLTCVEKLYPTKDMRGVNPLDYSATIQTYVEDTTATSAWYIDQEGERCWLCPAQLKFFGQVADTIYAKIG